MEKAIFVKHKGRLVKLGLKPNNFTITGTIDAVFDDCIEFTTNQKTSYLEFESIASLVPMEE